MMLCLGRNVCGYLLTQTSRWIAQATMVLRGYGLQGVNFGLNLGSVTARRYGV